MRRYVEEEELLALVVGPGFYEVKRWLAKQPTAPELVGATAAAALLGVQPPHLARLRAQGRMPEPIPVEGGYDAYERSDVMELAVELSRERAERAAKRMEEDRRHG